MTTGLAFLQAIVDGSTPPPPIGATLVFALVEVQEGLARFRMTPGAHLYNPMNAVHGGVACVLLDSAMGSAAMTTLDGQSGYTTVDLTVHLTRAIRADTGPITAEGRVLRCGGGARIGRDLRPPATAQPRRASVRRRNRGWPRSSARGAA